ncbi:MAG: porin [Acidobacteria bacterium]|nr:MAG: porin [Acidobacteriota bacterium]
MEGRPRGGSSALLAGDMNARSPATMGGKHLLIGGALLGLLVVAPCLAQEETPPAVSWTELMASIESALEGWPPRIEEYEARKEPLTKSEREELLAVFRSVQPTLKQLREGQEEASAAELADLEAVADLVRRIEVLLQKSQAFAAPEESRDAPQVETMITNFAFYGSLRARGFTDFEGEATFDDSTSRLGIRGQLDLGKDYQFFGRLEMGTNIVGEVTNLIIGGDPGTKEGDENVAVPLRLAFLGFEGPIGRGSFGKQWAVYYDVAVFTDQAPFFGGSASGAYAAGTDGGISGTGRADQALQYRFAQGLFKIGLQAQLRDLTVNNQSFADTWGASVNYQFKEGVTLGAAYNEVRDGVLEPEPEQPKAGDRAAILGVRWQNDRNYYAVTYADFRNHEKDDMDRFFSGTGWEIFADHMVTERLGVGGTWNYQVPDSDHPGNYKVDFLSVGLAYELAKKWKFFLIYKFDNSQKSDGTPLGEDTLGVAVFYNFSLGFSLF